MDQKAKTPGEELMTIRVVQEGPEVQYRHDQGSDPDWNSVVSIATLGRMSSSTIMDLTNMIYRDFCRASTKTLASNLEICSAVQQLNEAIQQYMNYPPIRALNDLTGPISPWEMISVGIIMMCTTERYLVGKLRALYDLVEKSDLFDILPSAKYIPLQLKIFQRCMNRLNNEIERK